MSRIVSKVRWHTAQLFASRTIDRHASCEAAATAHRQEPKATAIESRSGVRPRLRSGQKPQLRPTQFLSEKPTLLLGLQSVEAMTPATEVPHVPKKKTKLAHPP